MVFRAFLGATLVLPVALLGGLCGWSQSSPTVLWYRVSTSAKALYALFTLPQNDIDDFLRSYEIFDKEAISTSEDAQNIVNYYQVINHLCALGEVEKMYIPPVLDLKRGIFGNQVLWEETGMADKLNIGPGKKVLDVGCGRGRIAHHVASYSGAHVTGLNIDRSQIAMGREYAEATSMGSKLEFVEGNYNDPLPFADGAFDALYHVQALTYAKDLPALLRDMHRVLKPGAKVSFLDWFKLPAYDPSDSHHRKLLADVKAVIGAVWTPSPEEYVEALEQAGFVVLSSREASEDGGHQYPLVKQAEFFYETSKVIVATLANLGLIPKHFDTLLTRLTQGGQSFVEADKLSLFTTSWQIIAQKPGQPLTA
uniref:Methyltransferase type 11 domain-containing protein n=1 Tax=Zooxanthella nutricula TaxID=1333877 RepID=A0A7S2L5X1_9DINO